ncbi:hypothetical protein ACG02S_15295 [Roseateles sp. DC23W]|uniref:Secreted protein n=1 Tax=Pelomonas dachongensis TaxID=3299029 RepID=A0ABW7ET68_9BURK
MLTRRWCRVALLAVVLAVVAGWWGWRGLQRDADAALAASAPAAAASQGLAAAWLTPATDDRAALSVGASSAVRAANGEPRAEEDEPMEVCGLGRVTQREMKRWNPIEMLKAKAQMDALERRKDAVLSQLSARMAVGSDGERVAARLLMADVEGAALIAARTQDATAYRLALLSCRGRETSASEPSCRGLTAQAWSRLDPQDAAPWLWLMGDAVNRGDDVAAHEAMEQVLQRQRRSSSRPLLTAVRRASASAADADAVGLGMAMVEVVGRDYALFDVSSLGVSRYCKAQAVRNDSRRAHCERLVRWQFKQAQDLMDAGVALAIADRVGLPADQRPYTREQLNQAQQKMTDESVHLLGLDCGSLARAADLPARLLDVSELERALQLLPGR